MALRNYVQQALASFISYPGCDASRAKFSVDFGRNASFAASQQMQEQSLTVATHCPHHRLTFGT